MELPTLRACMQGGDQQVYIYKGRRPRWYSHPHVGGGECGQTRAPTASRRRCTAGRVAFIHDDQILHYLLPVPWVERAEGDPEASAAAKVPAALKLEDPEEVPRDVEDEPEGEEDERLNKRQEGENHHDGDEDVLGGRQGCREAKVHDWFTLAFEGAHCVCGCVCVAQLKTLGLAKSSEVARSIRLCLSCEDPASRRRRAETRPERSLKR